MTTVTLSLLFKFKFIVSKIISVEISQDWRLFYLKNIWRDISEAAITQFQEKTQEPWHI